MSGVAKWAKCGDSGTRGRVKWTGVDCTQQGGCGGVSLACMDCWLLMRLGDAARGFSRSTILPLACPPFLPATAPASYHTCHSPH